MTQVSSSPDSRHVAFVSQRPGDGWDTIWIADADGSKLYDAMPMVSPIVGSGIRSLDFETWLDHKRLALGVHCGTGAVCHYVIDRDLGTAWGLCSSSGPFFWEPNRQTAVVENNPNLTCEGQGLGIIRMSAAVPMQRSDQMLADCGSVFSGCLAECCTPPRFVPYFNSWRPDGDSVVYTERREKQSDLHVWRIGTGKRVLIMKNGRDGEWSADGSEIALTMDGPPAKDEHGLTSGKRRSYLALMNLVSRRIVAQTRSVHSIAWSPTGAYIAGIGDNDALYVWSPSRPNESARKLKDGVTKFLWSPDGCWIAAAGRIRDVPAPPTAQEGPPFPPVGSDQFGLSDSAIIKRYFEQALAGQEPISKTWEFHLAYARALDEEGETKAAAAEYQKVLWWCGRGALGSSAEWTIRSQYGMFQSRHSESSSSSSPRSSDTGSGNRLDAGMPGQSVYRGNEMEGTKEQLQVQGLYIVNVQKCL